MIEEEIYSHLTGNTNVSNLCGIRIFPNVLPQGSSYPAVAYSRISSNHEKDMDGSVGFCTIRLQVTSWDDDYTGAKNLSEQIRLCSDGYQGLMGSIYIHHMLLIDEGDIDEPSPTHRGRRKHGIRQDWEIMFCESKPSLS